MTMPHDDPANRESKLEQVLAEYVRAAERGAPPDHQQLLAQHPDLADELRSFFRNRDAMQRLAEPIQEQAPTIGWGDAPTDDDGNRVRYFGDYELIEEIARGGMGVVYRARQVSLNRPVALKMILRGELASDDDVRRFRMEAEAAANLDHPHIVPIFEIGEHEGRHYFSMKLIEGRSLGQHMAGVSTDVRAAVNMLSLVARAVHHAHQRGVLHRDLKPGNILLDAAGAPHVTDFGLARRVEGDSDLTKSGAIVGTPSFMAPEQAKGEKLLSTAVDVYSLGTILYRMLTGRTPFRGDSPVETLVQVMTREPERPRAIDRTIDRDLETIALKCLAKAPEQRFDSAAALADDLERWSAGKPILARPTTPSERLMKWAHRQPLLAGSLATLIAAALGLWILSGFLWHNAEARAEAVKDLGEAQQQLDRVDRQRQQAEKDKRQAERLAQQQRTIADQQQALADKTAFEVEQLKDAAAAARQKLVVAERDAVRTIYAADMQLAHAAWQSGSIATVDELLGHYRTPDGIDPRGFEWRFLDRCIHGPRLEWNVPRGEETIQPVWSLAVSPDRQMLATWDLGTGISLWNLSDGKRIRSIRLEKDRYAVGLAFADEGRKLVAAVYDFEKIPAEIQAVVAAGHRREKLDLSLLNHGLETRTWDLNEKRPAQTTPFDIMHAPTPLFSLVTFGIRIQHEGEPMFANKIARSADNRFIVFAGWPLKLPDSPITKKGQYLNGIGGGRFLVWDVAQARVHAIRNTPTPIGAAAITPDGEQLAIGYTSGLIELGPFDAAAPPRQLRRHRRYIASLCFSSDGSRLFSGADDNQIIEWDVAAGKEITRLRGHTTSIARLELSSDDRTLVSGGLYGAVKVWELGQTANPLALRGHETAVVSLCFAENSRELISVDSTGVVKKWRTTDGTTVHDSELDVAEERIWSSRLANNGKSLAVRVGSRVTLLRNLATGTDRKFTNIDRERRVLALSADDRLLADGERVGSSSGLSIRSTADGKTLATLDYEKSICAMVFAPDNELLIATHRQGVIRWDWEANRSRRILDDGDHQLSALAVSPDNKLLAVATGKGLRGADATPAKILIWNLETDQLLTEFSAADRWTSQLLFSPDGRRLATVEQAAQANLKLWDTTSGREVFSTSFPWALVTAVAMSPDGHRLAVATGEDQHAAGEILVWDATPKGAAR